MLWSVAKSGETATPNSPPSPSGRTPGTSPSTVGACPARTWMRRPSSRSVTSAEPSGRNASPQGTSRSLAMVAGADRLVGLAVKDGAVVLGEALGLGAGLTTGAEMVPFDPG